MFDSIRSKFTEFRNFRSKFTKFRNSRYKLAPVCNLYIGCPGAGKTTLAAYFAKKDLKHGRDVYSNVPIKGCKVLDVKKDLGYFDIRDSRIIIDEIGVVFNNRKWKDNLSDEMMRFIKLHRHYRCAISCFSQGLDFDNRFLGIAQNVFIVRKSFIPYHVSYKRVVKHIGVDEETHQLIDQYAYMPFSTRRIFAPAVWKMFDSFDAPALPKKLFNSY